MKPFNSVSNFIAKYNCRLDLEVILTLSRKSLVQRSNVGTTAEEICHYFVVLRNDVAIEEQNIRLCHYVRSSCNGKRKAERACRGSFLYTYVSPGKCPEFPQWKSTTETGIHAPGV